MTYLACDSFNGPECVLHYEAADGTRIRGCQVECNSTPKRPSKHNNLQATPLHAWRPWGAKLDSAAALIAARQTGSVCQWLPIGCGQDSSILIGNGNGNGNQMGNGNSMGEVQWMRCGLCLVACCTTLHTTILHYTTTLQTGRQATRYCNDCTTVLLYTTALQTLHQ